MFFEVTRGRAEEYIGLSNLPCPLFRKGGDQDRCLKKPGKACRPKANSTHLHYANGFCSSLHAYAGFSSFSKVEKSLLKRTIN